MMMAPHDVEIPKCPKCNVVMIVAERKVRGWKSISLPYYQCPKCKHMERRF